MRKKLMKNDDPVMGLDELFIYIFENVVRP